MNTEQISAMILAGGFSSRMGTSKAELTLQGERLIELQVRKLKELGIRDILLSGYPGELEGTRTIPDVIPHKGPLSGIHACLQAAEQDACLAISVDVPLLPKETLKTLIQRHENGITMLVHGEKFEPLMAVYDKELYRDAEKILQTEKTAMMKLIDRAEVTRVEYTGEPILLKNCNTPEDYRQICDYVEQLR